MPQPLPLTFEEFVERDNPSLPGHPRYDNFPMYFMPKGMAPQLRNTQPFLRFQVEHHDLEARLTHSITNLDRSKDKSEALKPYEPDLYQAYLILHSYGVSDEDLLIGPK